MPQLKPHMAEQNNDERYTITVHASVYFSPDDPAKHVLAMAVGNEPTQADKKMRTMAKVDLGASHEPSELVQLTTSTLIITHVCSNNESAPINLTIVPTKKNQILQYIKEHKDRDMLDEFYDELNELEKRMMEDYLKT